MDHHCIISGCPNHGDNRLGVRCRVGHGHESPFPEKGPTYSMISIDAGFLCDAHALGGVDFELRVTPTTTREALLAVRAGENVVARTKPIRQPLADAA